MTFTPIHEYDQSIAFCIFASYAPFTTDISLALILFAVATHSPLHVFKHLRIVLSRIVKPASKIPYSYNSCLL